jgi:hypothetical protein
MLERLRIRIGPLIRVTLFLLLELINLAAFFFVERELANGAIESLRDSGAVYQLINRAPYQGSPRWDVVSENDGLLGRISPTRGGRHGRTFYAAAGPDGCNLGRHPTVELATMAVVADAEAGWPRSPRNPKERYRELYDGSRLQVHPVSGATTRPQRNLPTAAEPSPPSRPFESVDLPLHSHIAAGMADDGFTGLLWNDRRVPLQLDDSRALRTHDQLVSLVSAVLGAGIEDESRSIEWKSGYSNLADNDSSFAIARAILGLANRPVSIAHTAFEGVGYLLIGVEPTVLRGQSMPESAELLNAVRRYTGNGSPQWDPRSVSVGGTKVLVITVEAPRAGDRIALLNKSYQPARGSLVAEGTIFVRHPGATERATRDDLEMLQDRLLDGALARAEIIHLTDHHREIRAIVAELVHAAHQWAIEMDTLIAMSGNDGWREWDWIEWTNSDSGRGMATAMQTVIQDSRRLRLQSSDPALLDPLGLAEELLNDPRNWYSVRENGPTSSEVRRTAHQRIAKMIDAFKALEHAAIRLVSEPPAGNRA